MTSDGHAAGTTMVIRATARSRLLLIALIAGAAALILFLQHLLLPKLYAAFDSSASPDMLADLRLLLCAAMAAGALPGFAMIVTGVMIRRRGQFPLPNAWVWRDTVVRTGSYARRVAWLCIGAGALGATVCLAFACHFWVRLGYFLPSQ